ncbi:hypothetical protein FXO38_14961 [Capsicum annuum]|nr:hypothetical protein FXO38_14961 [Capsicum annuum]
MVLLDSICGVVGGIGIYVFGGGVGGLGIGIGGIGGGLCGIGGGIVCCGGGPSVAIVKKCLPKEKKLKVDQLLTTQQKRLEYQSGQNEAEESDNSFSPMGREIISKSQHYFVKTISVNEFRVAMLMNSPNIVFCDIVLKYQLGKPFKELRSIIKKEKIDGLCKKSCFAYFLELSEDHTLCFPMIMVYGLLERMIKYAGDDEDSKEDRKNMDEI